MLLLILILVLVIVPACTWWFGLWNNLINLVNFLLAGLIATSVFHPVAAQIIGINRRSYSGVADIVAIWLVFGVTFIVLRGITDSISKYKLKFDPITEIVGRSVLALLLGFGFMCFTSFTLQYAPLPSSVYGTQQQGSLPDQIWVNYVNYASISPLAASQESNFLFAAYALPEAFLLENVDSRQFNPRELFYESAKDRRMFVEMNKQLSKDDDAN